MIRRAAGTLVALPLLYLIAALLGAVLPGGRAPQSPDHRILLVAGPIHYDLLLPLDDTTRMRFSWLADTGIALDHPDARWLVMGWGARDFYTTVGAYSDVTLQAVWRGLTGDSAVMHVILASDPDQEQARALLLDSVQYAALLAAIERSFARGPVTPALPLPGFHDYDRFYAGNGTFHLFNTCNVWVGDVLRAAGVRFGRWTPLPISVTLSARLWGQRATVP